MPRVENFHLFWSIAFYAKIRHYVHEHKLPLGLEYGRGTKRAHPLTDALSRVANFTVVVYGLTPGTTASTASASALSAAATHHLLYALSL